VPLGTTIKIPIEVKTNKAQPKDVSQLRAYMDEIRDDCQTGALIAAEFAKSCAQKAADSGIRLFQYTLSSDLKQAVTFEEIFQGLTLKPVD
jgi:RecB family endonuclease NucS